MIPFLELFGGNFQDAVTLMELLTTTVKLLGACDGTAVVGKTLLSINLSQTLKALTDKGFFLTLIMRGMDRTTSFSFSLS